VAVRPGRDRPDHRGGRLGPDPSPAVRQNDRRTHRQRSRPDRSVPHHRSPDNQPAWAPSREELVFSSDCDDTFHVADAGIGIQLWHLDLRTGRVSRLTDDAAYNYVFAAYSPDGRSIAFLRASHQPNTPFQVGVMKADGSGLRVVTAGPGTDWPPAVWSPDGTRLAFDENTSSLIPVVLSSSTLDGRQPLISTDFHGFLGDWASSGYVFEVGSDVAFMRPDQSLVQLTGTGTGAASANSTCRPAISPDGRSVAYDSGGQIFTVRTDGTSRRQLTSTAGSNTCVGW
jgi:Tol biopolymer transport system component